MKRLRKILLIVISLCLLNITSVKAADNVEEFVKRLYVNCLNRQPDAKGLSNWVKALKTNEKDAAKVVEGFFFSQEMNNLHLSDSEFVERCYRTLLDRRSDSKGKANWLNKLAKGVSKKEVLKGFIDSQEFTNLCKKYGVRKGTIILSSTSSSKPTTSVSKPASTSSVVIGNDSINDFVERLYNNVLNRKSDSVGLNNWTKILLEKRQTPTQVATDGFFHSKEFKNRAVNNNDFVEILYKTFLNRSSDKVGKENWLKKLNQGSIRDSIIVGFAKSQEFNNIINKSGWKEASDKYISKELTNVNSLIIIANKKHRLSSSYEPKDLREPNVKKRGSVPMRKEAATALEKMFNAAKKDGITLVAGSGYRSYSNQVSTYNYWVSIDGQANADRYSARPGYSEHQTGLAMDISDASGNYYLTEAFGNTREGKWLKNISLIEIVLL